MDYNTLDKNMVHLYLADNEYKNVVFQKELSDVRDSVLKLEHTYDYTLFYLPDFHFENQNIKELEIPFHYSKLPIPLYSHLIEGFQPHNPHLRRL